MSLPARKQPGARRRREKQSHLRRVRRRLLGVRPWIGPAHGKSVLKDVLETIRTIERK